MARIDRGYLLIADIGGYTSYLKGVELEHAHDVLADLIGVIATTLGTAPLSDALDRHAASRQCPVRDRARLPSDTM